MAQDGSQLDEATIKAMPKAVSRKISAGQVILDPANIVKELLENSIDAGASHVEIRLREDGASSIEVADNGTGISRNSLELLSTDTQSLLTPHWLNSETTLHQQALII